MRRQKEKRRLTRKPRKPAKPKLKRQAPQQKEVKPGRKLRRRKPRKSGVKEYAVKHTIANIYYKNKKQYSYEPILMTHYKASKVKAKLEKRFYNNFKIIKFKAQ